MPRTVINPIETLDGRALNDHQQLQGVQLAIDAYSTFLEWRVPPKPRQGQ